MKARIVKIGNSRGIRIPKLLLDQTGLGDEVNIEIDRDRLIIAPAARPRAGWATAFREMAQKGDDTLLDGDRAVPTKWDEGEWEW